jgi:hypothetical protein
VYIRVVEVTGNEKEPIFLENDDVLKPRDNIRLLDEIPVDGEANDIGMYIDKYVCINMNINRYLYMLLQMYIRI